MGLIWARVFSVIAVLLLCLISLQLFWLTVELRTVGGELKLKMIETSCGMEANTPCHVTGN